MGVGFFANFLIGIAAYIALRSFTRLRRVDAATVAGYDGSDSAGTFATCVGVLRSLAIPYAAYMPVMLAVMEIPGCLVALYLVSRLRRGGMDASGHMPDEAGYVQYAVAPAAARRREHGEGHAVHEVASHGDERVASKTPPGLFGRELLHEVFLNPGLFLLFGGIVIGFVGQKQGGAVTEAGDELFLKLFQGLLCLFLLEMGMTASRKLKDLGRGGWQFIAFGLIAPPVFATTGIAVAHAYSMVIHQELRLGTYVLFSVLCGAASYIAVPAVQRLANPETSPTLPLAASLGLAFSFNVTIGIPLYIQLAKVLMQAFPAH